MRQKTLFATRRTRRELAHSSEYPADVEILAPTLLEYRAVRRTLPQARVRWAGMRLAHWHGAQQGSAVVVCGLAGALTSTLPPGTVLIPDQVGLSDGSVMQCDPRLVEALVAGTQALHLQAQRGALLTSPALIVGDERQTWFQRGFVAADMETGLLAQRGLRVATIRVILDGPEHELAPGWLHPARALLQPRLWRELLWLSRTAPRYALLAARIARAGLYPR